MNHSKYDVIVAGLGTAGAIAAISAAQKGLKVLGIERLNAMGGTATLGAVGGYYFGSKGGLFEDINRRAKAVQRALYADAPYMGYHAKAAVLAERALDSGAELLFEAVVTGVLRQGNQVTGLRFFWNGQQHDVQAAIVIDCTGEADVCRLAGCETRMGRALDGQAHPFSNLSIACFNGVAYGLNKDSGYVNQTDESDLSYRVVESTANLLKVMQDKGDGSFLTNAALLGIREGHTIVGEHTITLEDVLRQRPVEQPLFYAYSNVDHHGKDIAFEDQIMKDWLVAAGLFGVNLSVGVPAGALIPKGYSGLLVAGRCLAVDHDVTSLLRMKSDMEKCGEAAAALAYVAIKTGVPPIEADYTQVAELLTATGCLDEANNVGQQNRVQQQTVVPFQWLEEPEDIVAALDTHRPGIAIWSARRLGEAVVPALTECLQSDSRLLRRNAAIALGLLGRLSAAPVLRDMVQTRDGFVPQTCVKYTYTHGASACYLLGRLGDREAVATLLDVMRSHGAFDDSNYAPDELYQTPDDVRFQYMAQALAALADIVSAHPELRPSVGRQLRDIVMAPDFVSLVSLKDNPHMKHDMTGLLRGFYRRMFE